MYSYIYIYIYGRLGSLKGLKDDKLIDMNSIQV